MEISTWIRGARLKTLPLAIAPVVIGAALSWRGVFLYSQGGDIWHEPCPFFGGRHDLSELKFGSLVGECQRSAGWFILVAVLCGCVALFLQVAANFANDYSDGIRGTDAGRDTDESKSGKPQRLTASGLVPAKHVLFAAMICAAIACICGVVAVVLAQAWWLLAVGVASLLAGWFYTGGKHPYGYVGLGEVGVFLFFGLAAVLGTEYALCGTVDVGGLLGAVAAGLFSCLIMMVNNIRDIDEDREHGKHTLAVRLGESGARTLLIVCCVIAWIIALLMCGTLWWPWGAVLLLSGTGIPVRMVSSVNKRQFRPALPAASFQTLLFAVVLAVAVAL